MMQRKGDSFLESRMVIIILSAEKLRPRNARISGRVIERISGISGRLIIENLTWTGAAK